MYEILKQVNAAHLKPGHLKQVPVEDANYWIGPWESSDYEDYKRYY